MQTNLQTKTIAFPQNRSQAQTENTQTKMASLWQEKNTNVQSNNLKSDTKIDLSPKEQHKVNQFIDELKSKSDKKIFFSYVFKTMIHLGKNEKQNFIAGVSQTLQSSNDPELISLNKKFNRSLSQYMSISLASTPLINQLRHNISNISLENNDDEEEIELF
ncbi:TPA: hypothetical protein ACPFI9_003720 [Providencia rettgeri]